MLNEVKRLGSRRTAYLEEPMRDASFHDTWILFVPLPSNTHSPDFIVSHASPLTSRGLLSECRTCVRVFVTLFTAMVTRYNAARRHSRPSHRSLQGSEYSFPVFLPLSFFLGDLLCTRFLETFAIGDYDEATTSLNRAIALASDLPEGSRSHVQKCLWCIPTLSRVAISGKSEYLEEAINHNRT
jgi:hypothetical protein